MALWRPLLIIVTQSPRSHFLLGQFCWPQFLHFSYLLWLPHQSHIELFLLFVPCWTSIFALSTSLIGWHRAIIPPPLLVAVPFFVFWIYSFTAGSPIHCITLHPQDPELVRMTLECEICHARTKCLCTVRLNFSWPYAFTKLHGILFWKIVTFIPIKIFLPVHHQSSRISQSGSQELRFLYNSASILICG